MLQVSIVFFTESWRPDSFYDKMKRNKDLGMHTLCLVGRKIAAGMKHRRQGARQSHRHAPDQTLR